MSLFGQFEPFCTFTFAQYCIFPKGAGNKQDRVMKRKDRPDLSFLIILLSPLTIPACLLKLEQSEMFSKDGVCNFLVLYG